MLLLDTIMVTVMVLAHGLLVLLVLAFLVQVLQQEHTIMIVVAGVSMSVMISGAALFIREFVTTKYT
jgi:hypothetical protein